MAKISIIVPVYNAEKYLDQCVESIINQTFSDFELLLIDDGSRDHSAQMCDAWTEKDARIRAIHKENGGPQSAVIAGIQNAQSDIIGFCDSDDYVAPDYYETLYNGFDNQKADLVCCQFTQFSEKDEPQYCGDPDLTVRQSSEILEEVWEKSGRLIVGNNRYTKLFRRDWMLDVLKELDPQLPIGEDALMVLLYLERCGKVACFDHYSGYFYRQVPTSLMNTLNEKFIQSNLCYIGQMETMAEKYGHPFAAHDIKKDALLTGILYKVIADRSSIRTKVDLSRQILSELTDPSTFAERHLTKLNPIAKAGFRLIQNGHVRAGVIYGTLYIRIVQAIIKK